MKTHLKLSALSVLAALLVPGMAFAAGASLSIQQVELRQKTWPKARAYVNITASNGSPLQGLPADTIKVYEAGSSSSSKVLKVETLEQAGTGASIVIVVQASGAWMVIQEDVKKALTAFINGLGEKDQVAVVQYAEQPEILAPFSAEKSDVASKAAKLTATGKSFLLYDGIAMALSLFAGAGSPGKAQASNTEASLLPAPKAIIVIGDGRDNGSATDVEKVIGDAKRRRIPIYSIGHTELDSDGLVNLEVVSKRSDGAYKFANTVDEIGKNLTSIKDYIGKMYVIEWKTELDHDGKDHKIDIAMENEAGAALKGSISAKAPNFTDWLKIGIIAGIILLLVIIAVVVYVLTRPKPPPERFCPVCRRAQMPDWEMCLFCLKSAKARLVVEKGAQKGKVYPLVGKIVNIGSGPENSIRIMDGAVSGKHAGVAIDGDKFEVVDLGSKNGVLVNGKKTPRRFLRNGDILTLGMTSLKFESSIATADDEADD